VLKVSLIESGQDSATVAAIVAPAGQAIGAQTPEEIALSVLAAVVAARRAVASGAEVASVRPQAAAAKRPLPLPALSPASASASAPASVKAGGSCCGGGA
jgi:xanthine dehydrogenase accessory factor